MKFEKKIGFELDLRSKRENLKGRVKGAREMEERAGVFVVFRFNNGAH